MAGSLLRALEGLAYRGKNRLVNLFDPPVVVLLYHRVATLDSDPQSLAVTPDNFRAQLQFLKNHGPIARFEDDWSKLKKPAIVVTFDDGYADNAREALPILEEVGVPATFFVSTGTIGTQQEFWWDELERFVLGEGAYPGQFALDDNRFGRSWPTGTAEERRGLFQEIQALIKQVDSKRREGWLEQLRHWSRDGGMSGAAHRAMTVEELRTLAGSRWVTLGAHSVTHAALSALPLEDQREEIVASKRQLEAWLGQDVTVFSYPYGTRDDYSRGTAQLCREAGFAKAAANFPAQAHSWTDPYQIPRCLVRNWSVDTFAEKLKGYWYS